MPTRTNHAWRLLALGMLAPVGCATILGIEDVPEPKRTADAGPGPGIDTIDAGTTDPALPVVDPGGCAYQDAGTLCGPDASAEGCGPGNACCHDYDDPGSGVCRPGYCLPPEAAWECEGSETCGTAICCSNVEIADPLQCPLLGAVDGGVPLSTCYPGDGGCGTSLRLCKPSDPTSCPAGSKCTAVSVSSAWLRGTVGACVPTE